MGAQPVKSLAPMIPSSTLGRRDEEMRRLMADAPATTDTLPEDQRPCEVTCCDLQAVRHIHAAAQPVRALHR